MEQLLRGEEIPAITKYDIESPVLYFPIRHHSPACSWHLKQAIEAYKPEVILIEGPENAQEQIDTLKSYGTVEKIAEKQRAVFRFFTNTGHKAGKKL